MRSGACKLKSAQHQTMRLRRFFPPMLEQEIPAMTARRAAALYESHRGQKSLQTGRPLGAATQRLDLWTAQFFFGWAVKRGYAGLNPFKDINSHGSTKLSAEALLRVLDEETLTRLAELLRSCRR